MYNKHLRAFFFQKGKPRKSSVFPRDRKKNPKKTAERRIDEARFSLHLSDLGLTSFPKKKLGKKRKTLRALYANNNDLEQFPQDGLVMRRLVTLELSHNRHLALSPEINKFRGLISLDLSFSGLRFLPEGLRRLQNLDTLDLRGNKLKWLPHSLFGPKMMLRCMNLSRNRLVTLPDSIGTLSQLAFLDLSDNKLVELPVTISLLTITPLEMYLGGNSSLVFPPYSVVYPRNRTTVATIDRYFQTHPKITVKRLLAQKKHWNLVKVLLIAHNPQKFNASAPQKSSASGACKRKCHAIRKLSLTDTRGSSNRLSPPIFSKLPKELIWTICKYILSVERIRGRVKTPVLRSILDLHANQA